MDEINYIYKATNLLDGMSYVGQSVNPIIRINAHLRNKKNDYFHSSLRKYGKENFEWEILASGSKSSISDVEIGYIVFENTKVPNGYNMTDGGEGVRGYNQTEEHKQKRKNTIKLRFPNGFKPMLGKRHSEESKLKISISNHNKDGFMLGKKHSEETKAKMSLSKSKMSSATKLKMRNKRLGKKNSPESIEKTRIANLGHKRGLGVPLSEIHRQRISEANKGRKLSEESKRKLKETIMANIIERSIQLNEARKNRFKNKINNDYISLEIEIPENIEGNNGNSGNSNGSDQVNEKAEENQEGQGSPAEVSEQT
jgi:group I intron endonuclease